jgi:hypothetical protein
MAVDKLRLHKITQLIANEKWRELDSFLSSTDDAGVITSQISDDAIGEDFVSPMHIGKKNHFYPNAVRYHRKCYLTIIL